MVAQSKKLAFFLPNIFTALNMGCGFASIIFGMNGNFYNSSMVLLLGAIFDSVDGRVARMTGTESQFGEQFDSISDVVSFGMAPALLVYNFFFSGFGRAGLIISFVYLLCGALRLARFNANIERVSSDFFQGLPIPGAALGLVGSVLLVTEFPELKGLYLSYGAAAYVILFSFLMISNIPFNSFKHSPWVKKHKKGALFVIFILFILLFTREKIMIGAIINLYVFGCIGYFIFNKGKLDEIISWRNENEDEPID